MSTLSFFGPTKWVPPNAWNRHIGTDEESHQVFDSIELRGGKILVKKYDLWTLGNFIPGTLVRKIVNNSDGTLDKSKSYVRFDVSNTQQWKYAYDKPRNSRNYEDLFTYEEVKDDNTGHRVTCFVDFYDSNEPRDKACLVFTGVELDKMVEHLKHDNRILPKNFSPTLKDEPVYAVPELPRREPGYLAR